MKTITLRAARKRCGLTQEELERKAGVSQAIISRLERGEVLDPASSTVLKLAAALNLDPRALRFGRPEAAA